MNISPYKVQGCDISQWQGVVNFQTMAAGGMKFVYCKASQQVFDPCFRANWQGAKAAGLLRGSYHYLDWRVDIAAQANVFINAVDGDWGELPPVVDFEMNPALALPAARSIMFGAQEETDPHPYSLVRGSHPGKEIETSAEIKSQALMLGLSSAQVRQKLWQFLQLIKAACGRSPAIYTGYYYWLDWGSSDQQWAEFALWLAWYAGEVVVKVPPPWNKATLWQYADTGNGKQYGVNSAGLDMNWFLGSDAELIAFAGGVAPVPIPIPTPTPPPSANRCPTCGQLLPQTPTPNPTPQPVKNIQIATCNPNVRSSPTSLESNVIGMLLAGDQVEVISPDNGTWKQFAPITIRGKNYLSGGWVYGPYLRKI